MQAFECRKGEDAVRYITAIGERARAFDVAGGIKLLSMPRFAPILPFILCVCSAFAWAQDGPTVCRNGEGRFSATLEGVTVTVEATTQHGLTERSCEATLVSGESRLAVVEGAAAVDVDLMGADLGFGEPVVAIQFRRSELDRRTTYEIYSLSKTPHLLATLRGGALFSAADYKLDGKIDIRTVDPIAVDGFEGIPLSSFDFVPPVFLRFEKHKLLEVSAEYRQEFDQRIAALRSGLDRTALAEFKGSDGMLTGRFTMPAEELRELVSVKIRALEIVWAYLYSGREDEAWQALADMWPAADVDRVRLAIMDARSRGISAQVDEVVESAPRRIRPLHVYEPALPPEGFQTRDALPGQDTSVLEGVMLTGGAVQKPAADGRLHTDSNPVAILMEERCYPGDTSRGCPLQGSQQVLLDLVVDEAGKVRSARLADAAQGGPAINALLKDALNWKFIPAFKSGKPVACEMQQTVSAYR
jgi:hypothetical protein